MPARPQVLVVGGGFAGLAATRGLARAPVDVTLVDSRNHHLFQPLLYQVATAGLSPADIASPIRRILRAQKNAQVLLEEVAGIDVAGRRALLRRGELAFDFLVLATGATHSYFGKDAWAPCAPGLKTLDDALDIRRRVLVAFEQAERESDREAVRQWLTFVVIGGGPTGVEMAGAFAEIARHTLAGDFRRIDPRMARACCTATPRRSPHAPRRSSRASACRSGRGQPSPASTRAASISAPTASPPARSSGRPASRPRRSARRWARRSTGRGG
jgi:NADH dehydrogenase